MGLGRYPHVSLAMARQRAAEGRRLLATGGDPLAERRAQAGVPTFREAADQFIASHAPGWRNAKHAAQWQATLATYVHPVFGDRRVNAIETAHVLKALQPIWTEKPETASRVRQRIEAVMDWATAHKHRQGDNPARWRGHLDHLLPKPSRLKAVRHHPALPHAEMPQFMAALALQEGIAAKALAFTILTAARTGEAIGARWQEIDFDHGVWMIPASRTKAKREHRVPLSQPALALLDELRPLADPSGFVFPGGKPGRPLSNMALAAVLKRMKRDTIVVHGFRSTFRDWCGERTNVAREVAEAALAHVLKDKTEAAYARGDLFAKRAKLMDAWARHCTAPVTDGEVVALIPKQG